jgi:hypothetical protein
MRRVFGSTVRIVQSIRTMIGLAAVSVMCAPAVALSHEEWVMAFVRFVEWPVPSTDQSLAVCQPLDSPALALQGAQVRGLTLQVLRVSKPRDVDRCHVFSALAMPESEWAPWLATLKAHPILAVGVGARFCELGGAICLVRDEATKSEKYQLNLDSLSRAGFRVRSQLLRAPRQRGAIIE